MELLPIFKRAYFSLGFLGLLYFTALGLLTFPLVQNKYVVPLVILLTSPTIVVLKYSLSRVDSAIYMHKLQMTWLNDLTKPEQFGFAKNQVTPFFLPTPDGERIFAWHVLPLGTLMEHRDELVTQETGLVEKPLETKNLKLLMEDPEARLVIFCELLVLATRTYC
jgi:abhydrolase domain-containing protein 12